MSLLIDVEGMVLAIIKLVICPESRLESHLIDLEKLLLKVIHITTNFGFFRLCNKGMHLCILRAFAKIDKPFLSHYRQSTSVPISGSKIGRANKDWASFDLKLFPSICDRPK